MVGDIPAEDGYIANLFYSVPDSLCCTSGLLILEEFIVVTEKRCAGFLLRTLTPQVFKQGLKYKLYIKQLFAEVLFYLFFFKEGQEDGEC